MGFLRSSARQFNAVAHPPHIRNKAVGLIKQKQRPNDRARCTPLRICAKIPKVAPKESVMKTIVLVLAAATSLAVTAPANAQAYLNGAPVGGVGAYAPGPNGNVDDPRFRNNNWRDSSPDNWRSNNWREDRTGDHGTWRRNNWREDRADDTRPYGLRDGKAKSDVDAAEAELRKKNNLDETVKDDCRTIRNRPGIYSKEDCR
jgi:hypothetical protein